MSGSSQQPPHPRGRGSHLQPKNRFLKIHLERDLSELEHDPDAVRAITDVPAEYFDDSTQSIISENNSPDIPFTFSLNPYRGCGHGCAYCYARPTHEYLGFDAGMDFETRIVVKRNAAELFRRWLNRPRYVPQTIVMSGVTDPYQGAERQFGIVREILQVALEARQPISIITKNKLVTRDVDLLASLASFRCAAVAISLTSLDQSLTRVLEPRTSSPQARLDAIAELSQAGIPVHVMTAPIIPGLNDTEIPQLLKAAREAGAQSAAYTIVRLPLSVAPIFEEWLRRCLPNQADKVLERIKQLRSGKLNDSRFGARMRGEGFWAQQISKTFHLFAQRHNLVDRHAPLDASQFRRPHLPDGQLRLFD